MSSSARLTAVLAVSLAFAASASFAATPAPTQQDLQKQIDELKAQVEALAVQSDSQQPVENKTHIGGYGSLDYSNLDSGNVVDLSRFVIYFGHEFSEDWRFASELEVEHAVSSSEDDGEVEVEQAYVEHDLSDQTRVKGGLFLIPVGIINETHEPTTFYGVVRNPVETFTVPTTWREAGGLVSGQLGDSGFSYDFGLHTAYNLITDPTDGDRYLVAEGHQEAMFAEADDLAVTGRIKYSGYPGLQLAATAHHEFDAAQGNDVDKVKATLLEGHAIYEHGPFSVRALYATWDLSGTGPKQVNRDKQEGYYFESSYKIIENVGVFARYNYVDNGGGAGGIARDEFTETDVGVNYWPIKNVVLKADYQDQGRDRDDDGFNLGIGYQF